VKISILLRGDTFLEEDRFGYPMDVRQNMKSLLEKLILPVRDAYPESRVFLTTHRSVALERIEEDLSPCELVPLDPSETSENEAFQIGLRHVFENDDCDAVIVTRFDIDFIKGFGDWNLALDDSSVHFAFKDWLGAWIDHRRVSDTVHVIGRNSMPDFYNALIMCQLAMRTNLHLIYYFLRMFNANCRFIEMGHWDSNSLFANPEYGNPLYKIFNRPRLSVSVPAKGLATQEIRGE
jgi:hypothetical protein